MNKSKFRKKKKKNTIFKFPYVKSSSLTIFLLFLIIGSNIYAGFLIDNKTNILSYKNSDIRYVNSYSSSVDCKQLKKSETVQKLNTSITLNQSAYLPSSLVNSTFTLTNNYSTVLTNLKIETTLTKNLELVQGSLNYNIDLLGVNESLSKSLIFRLPNEAPTLDLVFLIDGSGSMNDEISQVKQKVFDLVQKLLEKVEDVRIGFVFFGATIYDESPYHDDRNVLDFTNNEQKIQDFLDPFYGSGGWEPWGDALHYLQRFSWRSSESTIKVCILITDEPCNYGEHVGTNSYAPSYSYYEGPELYAMAAQLKNLGIILNTMECYGWTHFELLTSQLKEVAKIGNGKYVSLDDSAYLMDEVLGICESIIDEYGIKITTEFTASLNSILLSNTRQKWILIDNEPPSLKAIAIPVFKWTLEGLKVQYRLNAQTYDAAGVSQVRLYYKNNPSSYQSVLMEKATLSQFTFLFPLLPEGTIIWYYFYAVDNLGNNLYTSVGFIEIKYEIPNLEVDSFCDLSLDTFECCVLKINITKVNDYALIIQGNNKLFSGFISYNSNVANLSLDIGFWPYFKWISLQNFTGLGILNVINTRLTGLTKLRIILATITNYTINSAENNLVQFSFTPSTPVILFRTILNQSIDTYCHCIAKTEDDFYFFSMAIFSEKSQLKTQIFHRICSPFEESGVYYIMVLYIDERIDTVPCDLSINYGYIDDEPYWDPSEEDLELASYAAALPAYFWGGLGILIMAAMLLTVIALILVRRLKLKNLK